MTCMKAVPICSRAALGCVGLALVPKLCVSATVALPGINVSLGGAGAGDASTAVQVLLALTALSLAPAILVSMTAFE